MIDIATVEEYMRAANPIPTLDAIAVAAADTTRATVMQAPTQPNLPGIHTPQDMSLCRWPLVVAFWLR